MIGFTRATLTLIAAAGAGALIWVATRLDSSHEGGYWATIGLLAGAGLVMALSQLLGRWTKRGRLRFSAAVFAVAFVPVAVVSLWVMIAGEPHHGWFHGHATAWSSDIHVRGLVADLHAFVPVLAFGVGLVFGYSFDTISSRAPVHDERDVPVAPASRDADEPITAERETEPDAHPVPGASANGDEREATTQAGGPAR
jgi:hypothetical protein